MNVSFFYPSDGTTGVPIGETIYADFDAIVDPGSINASTFIVVDTSDNNRVVEGSYDITDTSSGSRVSFTPSFDYNSLTTYKIILSKYITADTLINFTGDASKVSFSGPYLGSSADTYHITIADPGGAVGEAQFTWYKASAPLTIEGPFTADGTVILDSGIVVNFWGGTLASGETFSIDVIPADYLPQTYSWTFTTGSGDATSAPPAPSTSISNVDAIVSKLLSVINITPEFGSYNVVPSSNGTLDIRIKLSDDIDQATVNSDNISISVKDIETGVIKTATFTLSVENNDTILISISDIS